MKSILTILVCYSLLTFLPLAHAKKSNTMTCIINASEWGRLDETTERALDHISNGQKPVSNSVGVSSDAGFYGPSYIVFNLPAFPAPVLFGRLRLQVDYINGDEPEGTNTFVLYDSSDIDLLLQPLWDFEQWLNAKDDLMSGREYGRFSVHNSPVDDGKTLTIPLTYDAIFDINDAAAEKFAFGLGPGAEGWIGHGENTGFSTPDTDGLIQLELTLVHAHNKQQARAPCSAFKKKKYRISN